MLRSFLTTIMHDDLKIDKNYSEVLNWKPYDFLSYIEKELTFNGIEYLVVDLASDLGYVKTCINYVKKIGKTNMALIKYIEWIIKGLDTNQVTSLNFLVLNLKSYFGTTVKPPVLKKKEKKDIIISNEAKKWLDNLKAEYQK